MTKLSRLAALPLVALSLVFASCADKGPDRALLGPEETSSSLLSTLQIVADGSLLTDSASATIGNAGGQLKLGPHVLTVPAGAVDAPTVFKIVKSNGSLLRVKLTATRVVPNDVGSNGFAVPVRLSMSYGSALDVLFPSSLKVVWLKPDGSQEVQSSTVGLLSKTVSAELGHFSDYALAQP